MGREPLDDEDDDLDPVVDRQRQRRAASRRRTLALVGGGVVLLAGLVVVALVVLPGRGKPSGPGGGVSGPGLLGPSAGGEGESWNHEELATYLTGKQVPCTKRQTITGTAHGPACYFAKDKAAVERTSWAADGGPNPHGAGVIYCQKRQTAQDAKDAAGTSDRPAFSWGRFWFASEDAAYLNQVRTALGAK